ncbi:unnamed protein product [Arabidopsis halleri]
MEPFSTKRLHPWVSHLPEEVKYEKVVGHGLNAQELARNPRLDYFFVKDLNEDQKFEFEDKYFDAVLCAVGVQYLQQPEKVHDRKPKPISKNCRRSTAEGWL